jgi:hypothetical protein
MQKERIQIQLESLSRSLPRAVLYYAWLAFKQTDFKTTSRAEPGLAEGLLLRHRIQW